MKSIREIIEILVFVDAVENLLGDTLEENILYLALLTAGVGPW